MDYPLSLTGRVLLGMICKGLRTGYEIKQLVDKSTRHFWAASYGQIYPELRRLEADGLLQSRAAPAGGRARTEYQLTELGEQALREWLISKDDLLYELRDEGMLKLFFSDAAPEARIDNIRTMRSLYQRKLDQLTLLEQNATAMPDGPRLTLEIGLGITRWLVDWCERTERRLSEADAGVEV